LERDKIALDDVIRRLKVAEDTSKILEEKLAKVEADREQERLHFAEMDARSRDKIGKLELVISKLNVSVELLMASLRSAANKDENLHSLITKIEEIKSLHGLHDTDTFLNQ